MAKSLSFIIMLLLLAVPISAQTTVPAEDILRSIDEGRIVKYRGVEIIGDLDFTKIKDKESKIMSNDIDYHVRVPVLFEDCIFRGDVIAYRHENWKNQTHIVIFHEDAIFHGCEFHMDSAFKYSEFHGIADFNNAYFRKEALFKYAQFLEQTGFARSRFSGRANFKYAKFSTGIRFANSLFFKEADFKYTKFPRGVSFINCIFQGDANFKYAEISEPFNSEGLQFRDSVDSKYTQLEGRSLEFDFYKK